MRRLVTLLVSAAVTVVGCAGAHTQSQMPSALPAGTSAGPAAPGVPPPAGTGRPDSGVAALNRRLFTRASPPAALGDLPLGPGDLIEVSVFEVEELSKLKLRIPLRGDITLPLIGAIAAGGRTPAQLEDEIRGRLQGKYMHDPQVSVFVLEHPSQRISVFGSVKNGGVYPLTSRLRLADALAMAGGLTDDGDHVVYLTRQVPPGPVAQHQSPVTASRADGPAPSGAAAVGEIVVPIDLSALTSGSEELNVLLQAGDVIHVPRAGSYYVAGEVARPGSYFLKSKTTLYQALAAAGDVKERADWDDIRLYRTKPDGQQEVLTFSLNEFQKGQVSPEVRQNDVIVVGKSGAKTFLYGLLDFLRFGIGASIPIVP